VAKPAMGASAAIPEATVAKGLTSWGT
jgi:hypothetical protein